MATAELTIAAAQQNGRASCSGWELGAATRSHVQPAAHLWRRSAGSWASMYGKLNQGSVLSRAPGQPAASTAALASSYLRRLRVNGLRFCFVMAM